MRFLTIVGLAAIALGARGAEPSVATTWRVPVCMKSQASLQDYRAQAMTSQIFGPIGVTLEWRRTPHSCAETPDAIVIEVVSHTPHSYAPGALASALPYEGTHIVVFSDRVRKGAGPLTAPFLLAHVLAHEIAHVLQGVNRHSETGVLKASWSSHEVRQMPRQLLSFSPSDIQLIHLGLQNRMS